MSFLRWSYIVPRLVLLLLLFFAAEFGVGMVTEWSLETYGSEAIGAKVDVAACEASLLNTRMTLKGIEVANPDAPLTNLVEADLLALEFDTSAALRKKAVAEHGKLEGLRFGGQRTTSGEWQRSGDESEPEFSEQPSNDEASQRVALWLEQLESRLDANFLDELQAPIVAKQIRHQWPQRAKQLQVKAADVQTRIAAMQELAVQAEQNPLRVLQSLRTAPQTIAQLKSDLALLSSEVQRLPEVAAKDKARIAAAREQDEQLIREKLQIAHIDPQELGSYLIGDQFGGAVKQVVDVVRWVRQLTPAGEAADEDALATATRGIDVLFAGCRQIPDLLVRKLDISGTAQLAGESVAMQGRLTDFTTQPQLHGVPMQLSLATTNGVPLNVEATIDRTGPLPHDVLVAHCPSAPLPRFEFGNDERFKLAAPPSTARLSLNLTIEGEQLDGAIQIDQQAVPLELTVAGDNGGRLKQVFSDSLSRSLAQVSSIKTTVKLSGSLDTPGVALDSTLGPAVAQAMQVAVKQTLDAQAGTLLAETRQRLDSELGDLNQTVAGITSTLGKQVQQQTGLLDQIAGAAGKSFGGGGKLGIGGLLGQPPR